MYTVNREKFLDWFSRTKEDRENLVSIVLDYLSNEGGITIQELFDTCSYIPAECIIEEVDEFEEFSVTECKLQ